MFLFQLRIIISDFAVIIAIASMLVMDIVYQVNTPKLFVPLKFQPTREDRGWLVQPLGDGVKAWLPFAACIPAILAVILVFMDQQITALLVNRREHKLKVYLISSYIYCAEILTFICCRDWCRFVDNFALFHSLPFPHYLAFIALPATHILKVISHPCRHSPLYMYIHGTCLLVKL